MTRKRTDPIAVWKSADSKVRRIFLRFGAKRAENLDGGRFPWAVCKIIERAYRSDIRASRKRQDFAFHMVDWNSDAASMVALLLYPERFTKEEVWSLVYNVVTHAPNHMAAAAKLAGEPISDIFEVGVLGCRLDKESASAARRRRADRKRSARK